MPTILQVNFTWDVSEEDLVKMSTPENAKKFWNVEGLQWKVWLRDADRRESGGIYLFKDRASAEAYCNGPIAEGVKNLPKSGDHSFKLFEVREDVTAITGGPINAEMERGA